MKTLFFSAIFVIGCTANVQDLGTPEPPPKPKIDACSRWPLDGTTCTDDDPFLCKPFDNLNCVCGVDHRWVCLQATLGLLAEHALAEHEAACAGNVVYVSTGSMCACTPQDVLVCRPRAARGVQPGEHSP